MRERSEITLEIRRQIMRKSIVFRSHSKRGWLRPGALSAAERSYPTSEVSSSREENPAPRSGAAAERSYPASEVNGGSREELLCV